MEVVTQPVRLNATQIALALGITSKLVNQALVELGYMTKAPKGGYVLQKESFGEQCSAKSPDGSVPFVRWNELILKNKVFLRTIDELSGATVVQTTEVQETLVQPEVKSVEVKAVEKPAFKFDRGTFKAEFRTTDGHFVRSKAEVVIDNWMYANGIVHAYERRLPIEEEAYCDFFIPGKNIYIEFWGLEDQPKYLERKKKKIQIYKDNGLKLVELNEDDIKNIDDTLPLKLLKHGLQVN